MMLSKRRTVVAGHGRVPVGQKRRGGVLAAIEQALASRSGCEQKR